MWFLLPLAFDFKGTEGGGSVVQALYVLIVLVAYVFYMSENYWRLVSVSPRSMALLVAFFIFSIGSVVVALLNNIPFSNTWRTVLPFLLVWLSLSYFASINMTGNWLVVYSCIIRCGSISVVFSAFYAFFVVGVSIDSARYEILSPALVPFVALLSYGYFVGFGIRFFDKICAVLGVVLAALSVTRSTVLALVGVLIAAIILAAWQKILVKNKFNGIFYTVMFTFFILILASVVGEFSIYERWDSKVFKSNADLGFDVTSISRLAEAENQLSQWLVDYKSIFFGNGVGAIFSYDSSYFDLLVASGAFNVDFLIAIQDYQGGHNFYIFVLFAGGLVFGGALLAGIIFSFIVSLAAVVSSRDSSNIIGGRDFCFEYQLVSAVGFLGFLSFVFISIGGTPLGSRFGAVYLGAIFSFALYSGCFKRLKFNA
ncbi:hypothetical protein C7444_1219 [Sphaerotilus hippei]|uniref:O-antigen ligase-like membrane protein n=2 Tax=Sphaerotilus hippei TaxID=744406 RepID=A0A318GVR3_9BURK|nr:hypothetical protein C7444_1219 [Sphaerotilus hippei]